MKIRKRGTYEIRYSHSGQAVHVDLLGCKAMRTCRQISKFFEDSDANSRPMFFITLIPTQKFTRNLNPEVNINSTGKFNGTCYTKSEMRCLFVCLLHWPVCLFIANTNVL